MGFEDTDVGAAEVGEAKEEFRGGNVGGEAEVGLFEGDEVEEVG